MTDVKGKGMIGKNEAVSQACVQRIAEYWAARGYTVNVGYEKKSGNGAPFYPLTSDMKNGLPKGARWQK